MLFSESKLRQELQEQLDRCSLYLKQLRTGRATADIFEDLKVEAYGSPIDIKSIANVVVESALSVTIVPYDKSIVKDIVQGVVDADLGFSPVDDGDKVRINFSPLTEESRKETVKHLKTRLEEDFKKRIRQIRQDYMQVIEKQDGVSEDDQEASKKTVQKVIEEYTRKLEDLADRKEAEIMSIN